MHAASLGRRGRDLVRARPAGDPQSWRPGCPVALAAAVNLALATNNFLILEYCRFSPLFFTVQQQGIRIADGHAEMPTAPGLGVELKLDVIEQHPYKPLAIRNYFAADGAMPLI